MSHTCLSQGSCIGCPSTSRQIGRINSSTAESICVMANGGWFGFWTILCGAITCCTVSAGVLPRASGLVMQKGRFRCNPMVKEEGSVKDFFIAH